MCSSCSSVTSTTTMETILPLHITKVWVNVMNNYFFSFYTSEGSPKNKYLSTTQKKISTRQTTIKVIDPDFANSTKFNNYLNLKNWILNVDTNLTTGKCNLGTPFTYHVIIFDARAAVYRKDINYISPSPSNIRPWECGNLLFNSIYTLHSNSLPPSIPDIVSPSPPGLKRFCDTHISSRYIINSGEIHFAGKMIQWAKIICLITGGSYSLVFLS